MMGDWRSGETELSSLLCRLFQSRTNLFTDVSIVCADNKLVSAHKLILALSSQYFQDILYPGVSSSMDSPSSVSIIRMTAVDHRVVQKYLSYVYTHKVDFNSIDDIWETLGYDFSSGNNPLLSFFDSVSARK